MWFKQARHNYAGVKSSQVAVMASLNSHYSPTKGHSVLVVGKICSPRFHDLLITGLGPKHILSATVLCFTFSKNFKYKKRKFLHIKKR